MIILGIDPGIANTGFGVVDTANDEPTALGWGVIQTSDKETPGRRLAELFRDVCSLLDEHKPLAVALERLFHNQNTSSVIAVSRAIGVVFVAAEMAGVTVFEYTPQQAKIAVSHARADKTEVQDGVMAALGLEHPPEPNHAADALALALAHWHAHPEAQEVAS